MERGSSKDQADVGEKVDQAESESSIFTGKLNSRGRKGQMLREEFPFQDSPTVGLPAQQAEVQEKDVLVCFIAAYRVPVAIGGDPQLGSGR